MRADMRIIFPWALIAAVAGPTMAQRAADGPVLGAKRVTASVGLKIWVPDGDLRMVAWDRDSLLVRGHVDRRDNFVFSGDSIGMKLFVEHPGTSGSGGKSAIVIYFPRGAQVSVKTVTTRLD